MKRGFFGTITYIIKGAESNVVELITVIGPWLAPLVPAYLTYYHSLSVLGLPETLAIILGVVVEVIGLSSGHTLAQLWSHNRRTRAQKERIPLLPVFGVFGFYVGTVLAINLGLIWYNTVLQEKFVYVAITLLTVPAITIIALRAQHHNILLEQEKKAGAKRERKSKVEKDDIAVDGTPFTIDALEAYLNQHNIHPDEVGRGGNYSPKDIATATGWQSTSIRSGIFRLKNGVNGR